MVNIRTYVKRAYEAEAFSNDQVRNESNAFHHLIGMLDYLADVSTMNGHQKRNWKRRNNTGLLPRPPSRLRSR